MRHLRSIAALAFVSAGLMACQAGGTAGGDAALETDEQKASYGIGLNMGQQLAPAESHIDMDALMRGIRDAMAGTDPALPREELQRTMNELSQTIQTEMEAERTAQAEANQAEGEEYMAENAAREGVTTTESGLQFEVLEEGEGEMPDSTDRVRLHYHGTLIDGTVFDSSREGGEPATFAVGGVIEGFSEGLQMMRPGGTYRLVVPGDLAYGPQGGGGAIGPNQTLIFEVELLEVLDSGDAAGG